MKILILLTSPKIGGGEKVVIDLANRLAKNGFEVTLYLFFKSGELLEDISNLVNVKYSYDMKYKSMFKVGIPIFIKLCRMKSDTDLIIAGSEIWPTYIATGVGWIKGIKTMCWVHTDLKHYMQRYSKIKRVVFGLLNRISYFISDKIIVVSPECIQYFKEISKIQVLPNPIDVEFIKTRAVEKIEDYKFSSTVKTIISVSRLEKVKNIELILKAHKCLLNEGIYQRVLIIGSGSDEKRLKKLTKQLNITKTVTFLGYKANPYPYFAQSDIFVSASFIEGFSLTALEAMVLNDLVISTDFPNACARHMADGANGIVIKNNSVSALTNALKSIIKGEYNVQSLLINSQRYAMQFDKNNVFPLVKKTILETASKKM